MKIFFFTDSYYNVFLNNKMISRRKIKQLITLLFFGYFIIWIAPYIRTFFLVLWLVLTTFVTKIPLSWPNIILIVVLSWWSSPLVRYLLLPRKVMPKPESNLIERLEKIPYVRPHDLEEEELENDFEKEKEDPPSLYNDNNIANISTEGTSTSSTIGYSVYHDYSKKLYLKLMQNNGKTVKENPLMLDELSFINLCSFLQAKDIAKLESSCRSLIRWDLIYRVIMLRHIGGPNTKRRRSQFTWKHRLRTRCLTEKLWKKQWDQYMEQLYDSVLENAAVYYKQLGGTIINVTQRVEEDDIRWKHDFEKYLIKMDIVVDDELSTVHRHLLSSRLILEYFVKDNDENVITPMSVAVVQILVALNGQQHLLFFMKHVDHVSRGKIYWIPCPTHNWMALVKAVCTTKNLSAMLCDPKELMEVELDMELFGLEERRNKSMVRARELYDFWRCLGFTTAKTKNAITLINANERVPETEEALSCANWIWALTTTHQYEAQIIPRFNITSL